MRTSLGFGAVVFGLLWFVGDCRMPAPHVNSEPGPERFPIGVSPLSLVQTPEVYTGQRIRVLLAAKSYRTTAAGVVWENGHPRRSPLLIECQQPTGTSALDVIGTCRGKVGEAVIVTNCTVKVIPPPKFP